MVILMVLKNTCPVESKACYIVRMSLFYKIQDSVWLPYVKYEKH